MCVCGGGRIQKASSVPAHFGGEKMPWSAVLLEVTSAPFLSFCAGDSGAGCRKASGGKHLFRPSFPASR